MKNRKLFSKAITVLLTVVTLLAVTGCNNILSNTVDKSQKAKVVVSIDKVGRTVNPTVELPNLTDIVLTAKKGSEEAKQVASWTNIGTMAGKTIELEEGFYTFDLTAKKGGTTFKGTLQEELTIDTVTPLNFSLSIASIGEATETGTVNLFFYFMNDELTGGSFRLINQEGVAVGDVVIDAYKIYDGTGEHSGYKYFQYYNPAVPVGSYNLSFKLEGETEKAFKDDIVNVSADLVSREVFIINNFVPVYKITYDYQLDGVENDTRSFVQKDNTMPVIPVNNEEFYGWLFQGWYRTPECDGEEVENINLLHETGDFTLYAKWEEDVSIYFNTEHISTQTSENGIDITFTKKPGETYSYICVTAFGTMQIEYSADLISQINNEGSATFTYPFTDNDGVYGFNVWCTSNAGSFGENFKGLAGGGVGEAKDFIDYEAINGMSLTVSAGDADGTEDKFAYWQFPQGIDSYEDVFTDPKFAPTTFYMELRKANDTETNYMLGATKDFTSSNVNELFTEGKTDLYELFDTSRARINAEMQGFTKYKSGFSFYITATDAELLESCNLTDCSLHTDIFYSDFVDYVEANKEITTDSSEHITLTKCDQGIEVTVMKFVGEGSWWSPAIKEDSTGIGLIFIDGNTAPNEGESLSYIYPFTEEGKTYSFTFYSNSEFGGYQEEHLTCTAGGGNNSLFALNDDFYNTRLEISDDTWGIPYNTNYKLTGGNISSIFANTDTNELDRIYFVLGINSGDSGWHDTEWAGEETVDYYGLSSILNSNYNQLRTGELYVEKGSNTYDTLLTRSTWFINAELRVEFTNYPGIFIFKTLSDEKEFAPSKRFAEENTFTQNEDGSVSITTKIPEDANVANIVVNADSGIGIILEDIQISDEPNSLGYNNNGYLNFELPSPAVKGENLQIGISYYNEEYEEVENGSLSGKAKYDGKAVTSITQNPDGTITVKTKIADNVDFFEAVYVENGEDWSAGELIEITEVDKAAGYKEFTINSTMSAGSQYFMNIYAGAVVNGMIQLLYEISNDTEDVLYNGINASYLTENNGAFTVDMYVNEEAQIIVAEFEDRVFSFTFEVTEQDRDAGRKTITVPSPFESGDHYELKLTEYSEENWSYDDEHLTKTFSGIAENDGNFKVTVTEIGSETEANQGQFVIHMPVISGVEKVQAMFCNYNDDNDADYDFVNYSMGPVYAYNVTAEDIEAGYKDITIPSRFERYSYYRVRVAAYRECDEDECYYRFDLINQAEYTGIAVSTMEQINDGTFEFSTYVTEDVNYLRLRCTTEGYQDYYLKPYGSGENDWYYEVDGSVADNHYSFAVNSIFHLGDNVEFEIDALSSLTDEEPLYTYSYSKTAIYEGKASDWLLQNDDGTFDIHIPVSPVSAAVKVDYIYTGELSNSYAWPQKTISLAPTADDYNNLYITLEDVDSVYAKDETYCVRIRTYEDLSSTAKEDYTFTGTSIYWGNKSKKCIQNDDGTFTIGFWQLALSAYNFANADKVKIEFNKGSSFVSYSDNSDETWTTLQFTEAEKTEGYKEFTVNSPYGQGDSYWIECHLYNNEKDKTIITESFEGTAEFDGKHYCSVTERYDEVTSKAYLDFKIGYPYEEGTQVQIKYGSGFNPSYENFTPDASEIVDGYWCKSIVSPYTTTGSHSVAVFVGLGLDNIYNNNSVKFTTEYVNEE